MKVLFIASAPRSGSTWFSNLFNSHPDVIYRHEPLGRLKKLPQTELFHHLKHNHGLSHQERQELVEILLRADPDTTRPPFFKKSYSNIPPRLLHMLWPGAITFRWCKGLFSRLYSPSDHGKLLTLIVKETGWSIHLKSIMAGMAPDHTIFLLRHPCAIISSIKDGVSKGLMKKQDRQEKARWYDIHRDNAFVKARKLKKNDIQDLTDLEFWAIKIRVLYDLFMEIKASENDQVSMVIYEDIQAQTVDELGKIFNFLWFDFGQSIYDFVNESKTMNSSSLLLPESNSEYFAVHRSGKFNPYKWKSKLSHDEITAITEIIGQTILEKFWPCDK